jgi:hypothetical protein
MHGLKDMYIQVYGYHIRVRCNFSLFFIFLPLCQQNTCVLVIDDYFLVLERVLSPH